MPLLIAFIALAAPAYAMAHAQRAGESLSVEPEPWVVLLLAMAAIGYAIGLVRLWRSAGRGAGISVGRAAAFSAGWLILAVALCSRLDAIAAWVFSAHMVQHELLMVAAAPLLVLGRPLATWAWALPRRGRATAGRWARARAVQATWTAITHPLGAFALHAAAVWIWHVPALFMAALASNTVHALQHASFLGSALLFWWAIGGRTRARRQEGAAVLYLFATMLHTGALGALLTLSPTPWYASANAVTAAWGMTALEDQQIGGLIMWIPSGTVYVAAALFVMARWLAASGSPRPDPRLA